MATFPPSLSRVMIALWIHDRNFTISPAVNLTLLLEHGGPMSMRDIKEKFAQATGDASEDMGPLVSRFTQRFIKKEGWVQKEFGDSERDKQVELTPAGKKFLCDLIKLL